MPVDPKEYTRLWKDRIVSHPQILAGKPIIKGTRLSVEFVLDELRRDGVSVESFLQGYDGYISREDIQACREFAATGARLYVTTWAELDGWMDGREESRKDDAPAG